MFKKKLLFLSLLIIFIISLSIVSANENITDSNDYLIDDQITVSSEINETVEKTNVNIETDDFESYYNEKTELVSYLKDDTNQSLKNKTVKITVNGKTYEKTTNEGGKVTLPINLKPDTYKADINFEGDSKYNPVTTQTTLKIKKLNLAIDANDFKTYVDSDLFFKAKIYNKLTNDTVSNVSVLFKVYNTKTKKYSNYYATTDKNGIATLNKNLKVGSYKISTVIKESKNINANSKKINMQVKATAETGCCSFYVQVSSTEGVAGFRRDSTYAADLYIKTSKWHGRTAIKQYKTAHTYFFHSITTSDGWMMGTGGADNPGINKAIENLAGKMVSSGTIKKSYLRKIQGYERSLGIGHFAIKAPNGKFAVVWKSGIITGKLKAGEYISVPNSPSCYRHGTYAKFSENPAKAALKIGATDVFGVNRRDITVFHWKATTDKNYKTTSKVTVYAANDNGHLMGRHTPHLKDNIHFKNKYVSKNKLPKVPSMKKLGTHKFGSIDKLIKTPTSINAPSVANKFNTTKYFKVTVKNKNTKKAVSGVKVQIKVQSKNFTKTYKVKTDSNGVIKLDTVKLNTGKYDVLISPANNKYLISAKSKITIE